MYIGKNSSVALSQSSPSSTSNPVHNRQLFSPPRIMNYTFLVVFHHLYYSSGWLMCCSLAVALVIEAQQQQQQQITVVFSIPLLVLSKMAQEGQHLKIGQK
ncbi:hypothetical protein EK904_002947 [Melospiza melodia maxima]|nr:hypothetical protein EK904_002947 [Melospiza melodia maxima]